MDEEQETIPLAGLDAAGVLELYGAHSLFTEGVLLSYVDDRTILVVGFRETFTKAATEATGRVAWLLRDEAEDGCYWIHERRLPILDGEIFDPLADGPTSAWAINTFDDLVDLVAWTRGEG